MQIEVSEDPTVLRTDASTTKRKHSFQLLSACSILGSLLIGGACGYFAFEHGQSESSGKTQCGSDDGFDVQTELADGLDMLGEWFPKDAAKIRAHKKEIVSHIASIRDPEEGSVLRSFTLTVAGDDMHVPAHLSSRRLLLSPCTRSVAYFLSDVLTFLAGFSMFPVHDKKALVGQVQSLIETSYSALQLEQLKQQINDFVEAEGPRRKASVIMRLVANALKVGGSFVKLFFRWVAQTWKDPWKGFSRIAQTAAKLALWRDRIAFGAFPIAFQILTAERMIGSARRARSTCKKEDQERK